jgi:hypothetical protein
LARFDSFVEQNAAEPADVPGIEFDDRRVPCADRYVDAALPRAFVSQSAFEYLIIGAA